MDNEVYKFIEHDWPNIVMANQFGLLDDSKREVKWGSIAFLK